MEHNCALATTMKFIEVKSELGAGKKGSSLGIDALQIEAINNESNLFYDNEVITIPDENLLIYLESATPVAKYIEGITNLCGEVAAAVKKCLLSRHFPVVLSSDHSLAAGTIAGVKMAFPKKRIGVIWIDAHPDLNSPYTTPSGNVHGMPLAASLAMDNSKNKVNEPNADTIEHWEKLKRIGNIIPKIFPENLVLLGLRDIDPEESHLIESFNIQNYDVEQIRKAEIEKAIPEILKRMANCDHIYISIDADSIDPEISKGTGTPVPGGFSDKEIKNILKLLLKDQRVVCLELAEINPLLDCENKMAKLFYQMLEASVKSIKNKEKNL